ncbi:LacI family transcriptional regulator [Geodermatophilus sp. YIM 151500]|uniref:LacI family DNA-binding transcriptional regulator n=1 Tax=Geodermatophilus sp. YIM 151500 TaxID=2984531 RepID=UPI0021E4D97B|nr:LacI family DNA-binding transcriptional regulator [Geodermatophilus sp. YIM 151500]MCV2489303.1 LacI family transcriptional regulator [Geodermatophilus sp. YIM 151500]
MTTIKEVARRAGVAPASVTRALSGHPNVSDELRQKVLAAVAETGYKPDLLAAGLRSRSSRCVGIIVSDLINPLLAEVVHYMEMAISQAGYTVLLANSHGDPARDTDSVHTLHQRRVDAIAVMCVDERNAELQQALAGFPGPVVLLDREIPSCETASAVVSDHYRGTYRLTEHLLEAGHREILYLGGLLDTTHVGRERLRGFQAALADHGLEMRPDLLRASRAVAQAGRDVIAELLDRDALPSAIVVGPNPFVPGVLTELHARGVRVGQDVALASLDDTPLAVLHQPPVTALSRSMDELARVAARLLLDQLAGSRIQPRTVVLPVEVQLRPSTAVTAEAVAQNRSRRRSGRRRASGDGAPGLRRGAGAAV